MIVTLLPLAGIPVAYLVTLAVLIIQRKRTGVAESFCFFILALAAGFWSISQSRSSTAGIGVLGLPLLGTLAGLLAFAFGYWRKSEWAPARVVAWVAFACAVLMIGTEVRAGAKTIANNRARDKAAEVERAAIQSDRSAIAAALAKNKGHDSAIVNRGIRKNIHDRDYLLAALEDSSVSPDLLDSLARSVDLNIALKAVNNPNARAETLARVYGTSATPFYFYRALAAHPHTPPEIMRKIYNNPTPITGLSIWFAGNPHTPKDVLDEISFTSRDPNVINVLLQNPGLNCRLLDQAAANVEKLRDKRDFVSRIAALRPKLCQ